MKNPWYIEFLHRDDSEEGCRDSHFLLDILMREGLPYNGKPAGKNQEPEIFISPQGDSGKYGFNRPTLEVPEEYKKFMGLCQNIRDSREAREWKQYL